MRTIHAFLLPTVVMMACVALAADWPNYRGPNHNGISNESSWLRAWPADGPAVLWQAEVGIGFSTVAAAAGRVYTMSSDGERDTVYCFDAATGQAVWTFSYECPLLDLYYEGGPGGTPTVDGDRVYTLSKVGDLFCFNAADGAVLWHKNIADELGAERPKWAFASSPLVLSEWIVIDVGTVAALNKETGEVVWRSASYPAGYATPVSFPGPAGPRLACFNAHGLVVISATDGHELGLLRWETRHDINAADPVVVDDTRVFISSGYGKGCALVRVDAATTAVVWQNETLRTFMYGTVLYQGQLYGIDGSGGSYSDPTNVFHLRCVDVETGEVRWEQRIDGTGSSMLADGTLLVLSERGELMLVDADPTAYRERARAHVIGGRCWAVPVLSHGRIYVRNAQGKLTCLDVADAGTEAH